MIRFVFKSRKFASAMRAESGANLEPLSKSDLKVLNEIVATYADLPACKLEQLTQEEPAWIRTPQNEPINFDLIFAGHPGADFIKSIMQEEYCMADVPDEA